MPKTGWVITDIKKSGGRNSYKIKGRVKGKGTYSYWVYDEEIKKDKTKKMRESTKKIVKEGAGAGYTVTIKDLKFGKILEKERIAGEKSYEDYWRLKVEVVPGDYEIAAEDYYNDFFWQEHEFGDTPTAKIDGGVAIMEYPSNWDDEEEDLRKEVLPNVENREMDVSFDYGWGWTHADLPREKIEADHVDVKDDYFYGNIEKLELNAPDLADAVNCGFHSIFDRDDEEDNDDEGEEEYDESFGSEKNINMKWKKLMKESYDDEWASVGAAFGVFTQRLWRYTRQDRDNRIDAFQACTKTMEQAMRDYYNKVVADPES